MKGRLGVAVLVATAVVAGVTLYAWAQEKPAVPETQAAAPDIQWMWGEVTNIGDNEFTLKTLDYETDTEKEMKVAVDDKTTYENVKSFAEIKPQDTVAVDYQVGTDGRNVAKNISVEKPEVMPQQAAQPPETTPAAMSNPVTSATPVVPETNTGVVNTPNTSAATQVMPAVSSTPVTSGMESTPAQQPAPSGDSSADNSPQQ